MINAYDNDTLKILGNRVREYRTALGMSQSDLSKALGYSSRSAVNNVEKGKNGIPTTKIYEYARILGITVEELMAGISPSDYITSNTHNRVTIDLSNLEINDKELYFNIFKDINRKIKNNKLEEFLIIDLSEYSSSQKTLIKNLINSTLEQFDTKK